jgi:hypothetical protein
MADYPANQFWASLNGNTWRAPQIIAAKDEENRKIAEAKANTKAKIEELYPILKKGQETTEDENH